MILITIIKKGKGMSNLMLKKEIRRIVRESGYKKDKRMVNSVLKVLKMQNRDSNLDLSQASILAREILN